MDNLETSGTKHVHTEEAEAVLTARPFIAVRAPSNTAEKLYFLLDETCTHYVLPDEHLQTSLATMLERAEMQLSSLNAVLKAFSQALTGRDESQEEMQDYSVDRTPTWCLGLAALLFLTFFILVILSGYYVDSPELAYIAIAFVTAGLSIHLLVIICNGDFRFLRKRLRVSAAFLSRRQQRSMQGAIAVSNKIFNKQFLHWRLGKDGGWVELSELSLQRNVSLRPPKKSS